MSRGCEVVVATGRRAFMLRGRESLRWILEALVRARRVRGSVSVEELFDAGWPGTAEGLAPAARAQRVYLVGLPPPRFASLLGCRSYLPGVMRLRHVLDAPRR